MGSVLAARACGVNLNGARCVQGEPAVVVTLVEPGWEPNTKQQAAGRGMTGHATQSQPGHF